MYQKILIIRFSSIGDLVLITPVIRCIKNQTHANIHLVVKSKFSKVLIDNPHIAKIWSIEHSTSEIIESLRKESFDLIVDLHYNFRSILLSWQLRKPCIRFLKLNVQKWLMTTFKINQLPERHLVDRYFDSLQKLGIENDGEGLDFFIDEKEFKTIEKMQLPEEYVVGILGATYYTKQIPFNKWLQIIHSMKLPIVLLGGSTEIETGVNLLNEFPIMVINCAAQLSIAQSAAIIKNSQMVITPDTGMMHIAAAFNKPLHVIWGNTIPLFGMYPYFGKRKGIVKYHQVQDLPCRPCSKLGYPTCPKKHFDCMQKQKFDKKTLEI